jgi:hypothetical protein
MVISVIALGPSLSDGNLDVNDKAVPRGAPLKGGPIIGYASTGRLSFAIMIFHAVSVTPTTALKVSGALLNHFVILEMFLNVVAAVKLQLLRFSLGFLTAGDPYFEQSNVSATKLNAAIR